MEEEDSLTHHIGLSSVNFKSHRRIWEGLFVKNYLSIKEWVHWMRFDL